ncbi:DNA polymerase, partial [Clostridium perfringens]|nr:DNA polymerase [Clostridium perfringens]
PTWSEVWETGYTTHTGNRKAGILQTRLTDTDKKRVLAVKQAIENGELGVGVEYLKKFTKSHALNLYKVLVEQHREHIISEMIEHCPENYHLITTIEQMENLQQLLVGEKAIGLDTETTGLDYFGKDYIVGISMSLPKADYHCYIPFRHIVEDIQLAPDYVLSSLKGFLEDVSLGKILHNAKYDYHMFTKEGIFL